MTTPRARSLALAGLLVTAGCVFASPASAAPRLPVPTPTPPPPLISVQVPGVLDVQVPDVPVLGNLLHPRAAAHARPGGESGSETPAPRPTPVGNAPTPSARPSAPSRAGTTGTPVARSVPRPDRPAMTDPQPRRPRTAAPRPAGALAANPVADNPPPRHTAHPRAKRADALDALFQPALLPGVPAWVLLLVVGACGVGAVVIVRKAGRRIG